MILKVRKDFVVFKQRLLLWIDLLQLTFYTLEAMFTTTIIFDLFRSPRS